MTRKLIFIFSLFVAIAAMADSSNLTAYDLIKGRGQFLDTKDYYVKQYLKRRTEAGTEIEMSADKIKDILELNVVSYFRLTGYDSDLKKALFKETDEYKKYEAELKMIRDELKKSSFYYIHEIRNVYDIEKGGFRYDVELNESEYVDFPGYINHRTLCIEYATKRFPKNRIDTKKWWGGTFYNYTQRVFFPVTDKSVALKIEEARREQVGVLFLFKIGSTKTERPGIWPQTYILTKTESIYIINRQTGKIYCKVL